MKLQPLGDRIIVKPKDEDTQTTARPTTVDTIHCFLDTPPSRQGLDLTPS